MRRPAGSGSGRLRIVAGRWRGRRLRALPGFAIRPTAERAREALLDILEHGEPPVRGARFLDLFAGTGAVGLEALSRGAREVLLVEHDPAAAALIRANLRLLGDPPEAHVARRDATRLGAARAAFDLVFLDPPYGSGLATPALAQLVHGWLAPGARVVVEQAASEALTPPDGLALEQERQYGAARLSFLRAHS